MARFSNALVTGASSGIGRALCLELACRGTRVVAVARRLDLLESLVAEIKATGGQADCCPLDVRDSEALNQVLGDWDRTLGGFDLVIANAGVGATEGGAASSWAAIEDVVAVNFTAALQTLVEGKDLMLPRGTGTLAAVTSLAGLRALPSSAAYSATKAGLQTFLEGLEIDLQDTGLRVTDIRPGFVRSEMTDRNNFAMPYLWAVDRAARVCVDGLEARASVICFPWQLAWPMRLLASFAPRRLWRWVVSRGKPG